MKTVLITGGCGFIGSHVAEMYLANNYNVIVLDNLSTGKIENLQHIKNDNLKIYIGDVSDRTLLKDIFDKHKPNIINYHSAQKSVPYSVENPIFDINENAVNLLYLIEECKNNPIEKFIYVSSGGALSKILEEGEKSKESDMPLLESPYAINKFSGENFIKLYSKIYNFDYAILRYANVYGQRQLIDGESGVIPIFIHNIKNNQKSKLYTFDDMPSGCSRDYINVKDVAKVNLLATENKMNTTINIGSGNEYYILDIYKTICKIFEVEENIEICSERIGDIKRSVLNVDKAVELLGFKALIELDDGLSELKE